MQLAEKALIGAAQSFQAAAQSWDIKSVETGLRYVYEAMLLNGVSKYQAESLIRAAERDTLQRYRTPDFLDRFPQIEN